VLLVLVLIFSAFLRLYKIDGYMEFLGDQGRDVVHVWEFITKGNLMFIGPQTSIGNMYLGPWYYYLIAPSLWLFHFNPIGPAVFVAILGVLTTYLIYKVGSNWFDNKAGLFASLIFAISPVVIKYTSFSWNPNIMPFFSLLFIYYLSKKRYLLATISFVFVLNSHYLGLLLLIPAAYIFYITNPKPNKKTILTSLFVLLLGFLPLILFDLKHHGQNVGNIWHFFSNRQETVNLKAYKALPNLWPLFTQITGRIFSLWDQSFLNIFSLLFLGLTILFIAKKRSQNLILVSIWIFGGLVGFGLYKQHIYDHYFGFLTISVYCF
jgi:4-amino-4-deoxy-L-arabinose transferase-like glycosyltransferase